MIPPIVIRRLHQTLAETYNSENSALLRYLQTKPLQCDVCQYELEDWEEWDGVLEAAGSSRDEYETAKEGDDGEMMELCQRIDSWFEGQPDIREKAGEYLAWKHPNEAPTWATMSLNRQTLLPPSTWLVHWSNSAREIANHGFKHGVWDVADLALTTYRGDRGRGGPGYNFAFLMDGPEADNPKGRYGKSCVVFQSAAVSCFHAGDEEDQCIFWGPSITTSPVLVEQVEGFWAVAGKTGRPLFRAERVDDCFQWIRRHQPQYRRSM